MVVGKDKFTKTAAFSSLFIGMGLAIFVAASDFHQTLFAFSSLFIGMGLAISAVSL